MVWSPGRAVAYLGEVQLVDLMGLASMDMAREIKAKHSTTDVIDRITREKGVKVAVVYDSWFVGLPSERANADWYFGNGFPARWVTVAVPSESILTWSCTPAMPTHSEPSSAPARPAPCRSTRPR